MHNIPILVEDFIQYRDEDTPLITTHRLPDYIAAWVLKAKKDNGYIDRYGPMSEILNSHTRDPKLKDARLRGQSIKTILDFTAGALARFRKNCKVIEDAVWDSTIVLCTTLQNSAHFIYRYLKLDFESNARFNKLGCRKLSEYFDRGQFCVRERKLIRDLVEGDVCVLYFCAQIDRSDQAERHQLCTERMCQAYQIHDATYQTKHAYPGCDCPFLGADEMYQSQILSAVSKAPLMPRAFRYVPMITFKDGIVNIVNMSLGTAEASNKFGLSDRLGTAYVAISHVWYVLRQVLKNLSYKKTSLTRRSPLILPKG